MTLKTLLTYLGLPLVFLVSLASGAYASGQVTPDGGSLWDLAKPVYDAVMHGQYWLAAAGALILAAAAARKYLAPRYAWARGPAGSATIVLVGSFGGAALTALVAMGPGAVMSWALAWTALKVALAAAGGYGLIKALVIDTLVRPHVDDAPGWLQPALRALLWAFDHVPSSGSGVPESGSRETVADHRDTPSTYARDAVPPQARREGATRPPAGTGTDHRS